MIDDVIGIDRRTTARSMLRWCCLLHGCAPAIWQQATNSKFLATLNAGGETFAG